MAPVGILGDVYENSSMSLNAPSYVLLKFSEKVVSDGGTDGLKVHLFSKKEIMKMIKNGEIADDHTSSAWCYYLCDED